MAVLNANNYYLDLLPFASRVHQFIVSACIVLYVFFLFKLFFNVFQVHVKSRLHAARIFFWGESMTVFSNTTFAHVKKHVTEDP